MFHNTYQSGLLSIFYSCGSNPLAMWDSEVHNGHIKRITDQEVNSVVLEIVSTNVATTYISCPKKNAVLGIRLPFLVMIVKNLKRYFSFEITVLDDKNMRRRFRISNFQSTTKIKPFCTTMPIGLSGGWNQIQFNLADFTRRAYGSQFIESLRVQVHANARLRRIYFSDRLYPEEELPQEYKLYLPLDRKKKRGEKKEESIPAKPATSKVATEAPAEGEGEGKEAAPAKSKSAIATAKKSQVAVEQPAAEAAPEEAAPAAEPAAKEEGAPEGEAPVEGGETPAESEAPGEAPPAEEAPPGEEAATTEAPPEGEAPAEAPAEAPEEAPAEEPAAEAPAE